MLPVLQMLRGELVAGEEFPDCSFGSGDVTEKHLEKIKHYPEIFKAGIGYKEDGPMKKLLDEIE